MGRGKSIKIGNLKRKLTFGKNCKKFLKAQKSSLKKTNILKTLNSLLIYKTLPANFLSSLKHSSNFNYPKSLYLKSTALKLCSNCVINSQSKNDPQLYHHKMRFWEVVNGKK